MRVTAGVDLGGTAVNYTFITADGRWLIDGLCEHPSRAQEGPTICLQQIADGLVSRRRKPASFRKTSLSSVSTRPVPPARAASSARAARRISFTPTWAGFDIRAGLEQAGEARHLSERRECRRALGALRDFRRGAGDLGLCDCRHRPRRRRHCRRCRS